MGPVFLAMAIAVEVAATTLLNSSDGFSKLWPSVGTLAGYGLSFYLFALALRDMEVGIAYAIWAGIGTAAITVIGMAFLGESTAALKLAGIAMIVGGVAVVNVAGGSAH